MTDDRMANELRRLAPDQPQVLDALAERVRERSRSPVQSVVDAWADADATLSENASILLDELDELPISAMLEAPGELPVEKRVWMIRSLVAREVELRDRVAARLSELMDDRTDVPIDRPEGREEEQQPRPRRVCDEAYLHLRLLMGADADDEAHYLNVDAYLDLSEEDRDAEIAKTRAEGTFTSFLEP